jgi:PAS domain S-box-containing protein
MIFDAWTPQVVSVTAGYVGLVIVGYWLPQPKAALALALLATPLIIIGHAISPPSIASEWESWANRGDTIGSVWLTAFFIWRIRVLEQALQQQIDAANSQSRESALLASIVEFGDDAIVSKNLDGIITSWNKGAECLFGYFAEEVIGKPITILIPPERYHEEDVILGRIRRGDRVDHFETVRRCKDGSLIDMSLTISPVRDASGTVVGRLKDCQGHYRAQAKRGANLSSRPRGRTSSQKPVGKYESNGSSLTSRHPRRSQGSNRGAHRGTIKCPFAVRQVALDGSRTR